MFKINKSFKIKNFDIKEEKRYLEKVNKIKSKIYRQN